MPTQAVIPDCRTGRDDEGRVFVRHASDIFVAGDDMAESHAVIEDPDFQDVVNERQIVLQRDTDAVALIYRRAVGAVPRIGLVDLVAISITENNSR